MNINVFHGQTDLEYTYVLNPTAKLAKETQWVRVQHFPVIKKTDVFSDQEMALSQTTIPVFYFTLDGAELVSLSGTWEHP